MGKNILIFSDGTGQAGGLFPDENRSNVYKLYRATRCGPDSPINPKCQLAFYDPGLGSGADGSEIQISWARRLYNLVAKATGLGITRNIIDCYAAILQMWEPGDRIYLFGFSRGAYTARCVGGVMSYCGIPTLMPDGSPFRRDAANAKKVANEAVRQVYQHGVSQEDERFKMQRKALAKIFRQAYGAGNDRGEPNEIPYFIGVWDTVGALGVSRRHQLIILAVVIMPLVLLTGLAGVPFRFEVRPWQWIAGAAAFWTFILVGWYVVSHVRWTTKTDWHWWQTFHFTGWRMKMYDQELNERVTYAKHAIAIDENRAEFERVPWSNARFVATTKESSNFEQVWFAGVHSDIGGSYPENEARLSDISLQWMVRHIRAASHPVCIDRSKLRLFPDPLGMQHDERQSSKVRYRPAIRQVPQGAPVHGSVFDRYAASSVSYLGLGQPYRPGGMKGLHGYIRIDDPADVPDSDCCGSSLGEVTSDAKTGGKETS